MYIRQQNEKYNRLEADQRRHEREQRQQQIDREQRQQQLERSALHLRVRAAQENTLDHELRASLAVLGANVDQNHLPPSRPARSQRNPLYDSTGARKKQRADP
jgi:hypothetical protein